MKTIRVAFAGNPNCGKTTLFNLLTGSKQHVGNWAGVTVEKKEGYFEYGDYRFEVIDLPGIYSLLPNSIEEIVSRDFIIKDKPDIILNIMDGTVIERSLYLTSQLIDTNIPIVIAINMFDEVKQKGIKIDFEKMGELLNSPVIPITAKREEGKDELLNSVIRVFESERNREIIINYGSEIENAINKVENILSKDQNFAKDYYLRWLALNLLNEDDNSILIKNAKNYSEIQKVIVEVKEEIQKIYLEKVDNAIDDMRFGFVMGIERECVVYPPHNYSRIDLTEMIDKVVLNKVLSYPIFMFILWITFQSTFLFGSFFSGLIQNFVDLVSNLVSANLTEGILKDLLVNGIISGVGGVLVFLPQIVLLFLMIAILEDSGYMARVAFIMDKVMHYLGIHGKSFISLFMGIGCNVPGIMAARTLENEEDRKVTILINSFMSCSARLPIYILITGMFFGKNAGTVIFLLYFIGIIVAIVTAKLLKKFFFKKKSKPFVMELPPYRMPTLKSLLIHMWERASMFLKKMGGVIMIGSIIIWALGYFPHNTIYSNNVIQMESKLKSLNIKEAENYKIEIEKIKERENLEQSYIGIIGKTLSPVFQPLGFTWKEGIALITGIIGKEIVVSTLSVLYGEERGGVYLKNKMTENGMTPITAFGFLVFTLLYVPCLATILAVYRESNSIKWTIFSIVYGISVAYLLSFLINHIGKLIVMG